MSNYRKAKKGEVNCEQCKHSAPPYWPYKSFRCMQGYRCPPHGYAVSRKATCDSARRRDEP